MKPAARTSFRKGREIFRHRAPSPRADTDSALPTARAIRMWRARNGGPEQQQRHLGRRAALEVLEDRRSRQGSTPDAEHLARSREIHARARAPNDRTGWFAPHGCALPHADSHRRRLCAPSWCERLARRFQTDSVNRAAVLERGEWLVSISIQRFAPTPAAKFGLALDLAVLAGSAAAATHGPLVLRLFWASCALLVFWTTSSVVHHYAHTAERAAWENVAFTLVNLLSVATVLGVGGHLLPGPRPDVLKLLTLALPAQVLLRLTVFTYVRSV